MEKEAASWGRKHRNNTMEHYLQVPVSNSDLHISRSLYWVILNCQISSFLCSRRFFYAVSHVNFYRPVTVLKSLKRFLHIITRKKGEPTIRKNLTLHQPVLKSVLIKLKFSKFLYIEDLHISHCLYWVTLMCQNFYLFVLQVIFYGAFQLQKLHQ